MERLVSDYVRLCEVNLPHLGRQHYMHTFDLARPVMRDGYQDYAPIVQALCAAAGAHTGMAHMTVDEKIVQPGMSQRRPGPHVDGCFVPSAGTWGHGGGGGWLHTCNDIQRGPLGRMPVIVAASAPGCRVWRGRFKGQPKSDGDLSHISDQLGEGEVLPANVGYLLSGDCVHESMVFTEATRRTFLRIALPIDYRIHGPRETP
jgi:hypothetical protein